MKSRSLKLALLLTAPLLAPALSGCFSAPVMTPDPQTFQESKVRTAQNVKNKVDILFMVDNSPSMAPKQNELKGRFPQLIQILQSFGAMSPADYHIGVVTSDLGAGPYNLNNGQCHPGGDGGKLQGKGVAAPTTGPNCGTFSLGNGVNFIQYNQLTKDAMGNPTSNLPAGFNLPDAFTCISSVGQGGCGFEMQLESVYKALHDCMPGPNNDYAGCGIPENKGFLRNDALLVVVWVTDEDDCSADPSTDLFDPSPAGIQKYGSLYSYRCTNYSIACDPPGSSSGPVQLMPYAASPMPLNGCVPATMANGNKLTEVSKYLQFFTQSQANGGVKIDPNDVILVGITAPDMPVQSILGDPRDTANYPPCGALSPGTCEVLLQHSCRLATNTQFFGDPAVRLRYVINSVSNPVNKQNTSICDQSYQQALQGLGTLIVSNLKPGCLSGPLADPTTPDCVVEQVSVTGAGTTSVTEVPRCMVPDMYTSGETVPCWHLKTDSKCTAVYLPSDTTMSMPQQYGVSVEWGPSGPPMNTTAQVSCATLATGM